MQHKYKKKGGFNSKFGGQKPMHDATCADCGSHCQVPFKPNGRKPVQCSNCFRGANAYAEKSNYGDNRRDDRREDRRDDRPRYNDRYEDRPRSFDRPRYEDRPSFRSAPANTGMKNEDLSKQIKAIDVKMGKILQILENLDIVRPGDEV